MTARYCCPWCGSFTSSSAKDVRNHELTRHRMRLIGGLGILETFDTRKELDPPGIAAKLHPPLNPGVSGEGDE